MPEPDLGPTAFARRYDAMMFDPRSRDVYGASRFFNVGYWLPETRDQASACDNLVARLMHPVPADIGRLLDVGCGCGAGTDAAKLLRPDAEVIGVNISERQLRDCRDGAPECRFALMDALSLGFGAGAFDCVISIEAAFHFRSRRAFLAEAFRVLRPGGHLVLSDILFRDPRWIGEWMVPLGNATATPDDYAALLEKLGFRDLSVTDATAPCWTAFCRARLEELHDRRAAGVIDGDAFAAQAGYFANLMRRSLGHYLLVHARKPFSTATSPR